MLRWLHNKGTKAECDMSISIEVSYFGREVRGILAFGKEMLWNRVYAVGKVLDSNGNTLETASDYSIILP